MSRDEQVTALESALRGATTTGDGWATDILAALETAGWTLTRDDHAVDDGHPCIVCGSVHPHDHSTAEFAAARVRIAMPRSD